MNIQKRLLGCVWTALFSITSLPLPMMAMDHVVEKGSSHHKKTYDYVIVGCGSAGSILARKLSDNCKKSVLVLEAGENRNDDPTVLDTPANPAFFNSLWQVINDPQYAETFDIRVFAPTQVVAYTEGRNWGGGSSHNYLAAVRGTPDIYDSWAAISGNPQWSYNNMLPLMLALEQYNSCGSFDASQRGVNGPINITQNPPVFTDPLSNALATATTVGYIDDYNNPNDISTTGHYFLGYSAAQLFTTLGNPSCTPGNERSGIRSFSANEFLDECVVTKNGKGKHHRKLEIISHAKANKVLFKGKKAVGVQYVATDDKGSIHSHSAYGKKIILCAGAVNSAAILQRSGIGDPAVLEPLGIDVKVNNPLVGSNFINQYGFIAVVGIGTTDYANQAWWNLAQNESMPAFDPVYAYPDDDTRRVQIDLLPFGASVTGCDTFILEPQSRGSLRIVSKDPLIQPLIDLNMYSDGPYTTNGTDANKMITALNLIASGVGAANMYAPPGSFFSNPPGTDPASDEALFNYITSPDGLQVEYHILGTMPMGTSIANGVVDGNLNVFGVKNLMVADIGVLPTMPNGNTCYHAYMVGLRAATILGASVPPGL